MYDITFISIELLFETSNSKEIIVSYWRNSFYLCWLLELLLRCDYFFLQYWNIIIN